MRLSPNAKAGKLSTVINAWQTLSPNKSFAAMTLDDFKTVTQPSFDTRQALITLRNQITAARSRRDDADAVTWEILSQVVNAVKGDITEGPDGALYEAMGYIRTSERKTGMTNKKLKAAN